MVESTKVDDIVFFDVLTKTHFDRLVASTKTVQLTGAAYTRND